MFERVSRQVESSPCCDWGTPSSVYALHARNGAMFGPVEIGDSSTHQGALPCGASRFGLVNDGACAFADGWTARSTASRERHRFRAVPPCRMPRPRPHGQGASAAVSREAGDPRIGDGATALWGGVGRGGRSEAEFTYGLMHPKSAPERLATVVRWRRRQEFRRCHRGWRSFLPPAIKQPWSKPDLFWNVNTGGCQEREHPDGFGVLRFEGNDLMLPLFVLHLCRQSIELTMASREIEIAADIGGIVRD